MKLLKLDARGIVSHLIMGIASVGIVVVVIFVVVLNANHHSTKSVNQAASKASSSSATSKLGSSSPVQKVSTVAGTPGTSTSTPVKSTTTPQTKPTTSPNPNPSPTPSPAETPLHALTTIIADLENGISAQVTANSVDVPGPISTAQARPIVFTVNGQVYFAYTQGTPPNFNTSPSQTASSMAIVSATVSGAPLISAYLDKTNGLTDPNYHSDGYSTGGN